VGYVARTGQVVLLEYDTPDERPPLTGIVIEPGEDDMVVDLTGSAGTAVEEGPVIASIFAPEALYRISATLRADGQSRVVLAGTEVIETVQRRRWPRRPVSMPVSLVPVEDVEPTGVVGETVDIGVGGARVTTASPLPRGVDPLVALTLPDGEVLLLASRVVLAEPEDGHYAYRLAFCDLDGNDASKLAELVKTVPA
jgi:hypothetical protein